MHDLPTSVNGRVVLHFVRVPSFAEIKLSGNGENKIIAKISEFSVSNCFAFNGGSI